MGKEKELIHFGFNVKSIVSESECLVDDNTENGDNRQNSYIARHVLEELPHELLDRELEKDKKNNQINLISEISDFMGSLEPTKDASTAFILTEYVAHHEKVKEYLNSLYNDLLNDR